jgi:hypothetical protein
VTREKDVEGKIKQMIKRSGGFCVKLHADALQGRETLDFIGAYRGKPFMIEIKRPGGVQTPIQGYLVRRAKANGFISGTVESVEEFEELFNE